MSATPPHFRRRPDLRRRLAAAAGDYDEHAFVAEQTRRGLFDRLAPMTIEAAQVIDLGTATGSAIPLLKRRFPGAEVHGIDVSLAMLRTHPKRLFSRRSLLCADAERLPLADDSTDVVFANQCLSYIDKLDAVAAEIGRVLKPDGLFAFAMLGPDSFGELAAAWRRVDRGQIDDNAHVASFPDMHNVGDALVKAGFRDPVLDVDRLRVSYRSPASLYADLTANGARNSLCGRAKGLSTGRRLRAFEAALFDAGEPLVLELELVYGHAFGGQAPKPRGAVTISPDRIGRRRRSG